MPQARCATVFSMETMLNTVKGMNKTVKDMKKLIILLITIGAYRASGMQAQDRVREMNDSIIELIDETIEQDLQNDGCYVNIFKINDSIQFATHCIVVETYYRPKLHSIFWLFNVSERMRNKWFRQNGIFHIRKEFYTDAYRAYIREHDQFPYELILYFRCRFITYCQGLPPGSVMYGDYKIKPTKEGMQILDRKLEMLQNMDCITERYRKEF